MASKSREEGADSDLSDKPSKPNTAALNAVRRRLQASAKGLTYRSEQDKPLKVVVWDSEATTGATTPEGAVVAVTGASKEQVHAVPLEDFLAPMTLMPDWYGDEEREIAKRFRALLETLRDVLEDTEAFRVEKGNGIGASDSVIPVYVVGRIKEPQHLDGMKKENLYATLSFAGINTHVVET